jgi:spore photoproduct lyase
VRPVDTAPDPGTAAPEEPRPDLGGGRRRLWLPKRALVTAEALEHAHGRQIAERCEALGIDVHAMPGNRLAGLRGESERETYRLAKSTLAVVVSPPGQRRLQPIPPSADWQFHLAMGCPAHCQYCYLAGSLQGPPVTRAYANLDEILDGLAAYEGGGTITSRNADRAHEGTTFEASCYTDPLGIEHLTGSLAAAVTHFGTRPDAGLRFTTKFDAVDPLLGLGHGGRTRARFSVNALPITKRFEAGTASLERRVTALRRMALPEAAGGGGYPVGLTIAPIMPIPGWREHYGRLLDDVAHALHDVPEPDLTVELITHRFTPGSKDVLTDWYPATKLEMDEESRAMKFGKYGAKKYVYRPEVMRELRTWFEHALAERLPAARLLYWT